MATNNVNIEDVRLGVAKLFYPGQVAELRLIGRASGYYDDPEKLIHDAVAHSGTVPGLYVTINEIDKALLARSANHLTIGLKNLTQDSNVTVRRWLPIDIDAIRPAGISSTDSEHESALAKANEVSKYLQSFDIPTESIIIGDSGNGAHLLVRINLPNNQESTDLIRACLEALAAKFDEATVQIDRAVYNASRIWKLPGTMACKGDSTAERPHRLAKLHVIPPNTIAVASHESLERLAASRLAAVEHQTTTKGTFNLDKYLADNAIGIKRKEPYSGGVRYILDSCLFDATHVGTSAAIIVSSTGTIAYKCQHNHCVDRKWIDVREKFEPGFIERRASFLQTSNTSNNNYYNIDVIHARHEPVNDRESPVNDRESPLMPVNGASTKSEKIREYIVEASGLWVSINDLDRDLALSTEADKALRRQVIKQAVDKGLFDRHPEKSNLIRLVNKAVDELDLINASAGNTCPIKLPFDLDRMVKLFQGNVSVIAGDQSAGKSALAMNIVRLNLETYANRITFFSSEMGADELRDRVDAFTAEYPATPLDYWLTRVKWVQRSSNWADVIQPDHLNIIDYCEITQDFWVVADILSQIQRKLKTGLAFVCIQKKYGSDTGRGAEFSLEKPRLYLSLYSGARTREPDKLKIIKAKKWANRDFNPNGLEINYRLRQGCFYVDVSRWHTPDGTPVEVPEETLDELPF